MRLFGMTVFVMIGALVFAGCSNLEARGVKSVTLSCIQSCLKMEDKPFDSKQYLDKKSIALFAQAVNHADKMEGSLDYSAIFLMTIRMKDGSSSEYHLNIANVDEQTGLLLKLPNTEQGYRISMATSEKLRDIIYRT